MTESLKKRLISEWREQMHEVIFEADTPAGKAFDVVLIVSILLSVTVVMLESVAGLRRSYGTVLFAAEWVFTVLFTVEYLLRLAIVKQPLRYATSFFGAVDLLAVLPTYVSLFIPGSHYLLSIRIFRLLRIFRVFKLSAYLTEAQVIMTALKASRRKISVFLFAVITIVVTIGSLMYVIEGEKSGFINIPTGIYWSIVTLTTVGYGDLSPQTPIGKVLASLVMIMGYGIIAVPTGIVTAELTQIGKKPVSTQACRVCSAEGHDTDAGYCKYCGANL